MRVSKLYWDGAYDSGEVYRLLEAKGIEPVIKPRRNRRLDTRCPGRRLAVGRVRELGYDAWAKLTGYGGRWAVETAYSTFKRLFGECSLARSFESIVRELVGSVVFEPKWVQVLLKGVLGDIRLKLHSIRIYYPPQNPPFY